MSDESSLSDQGDTDPLPLPQLPPPPSIPPQLPASINSVWEHPLLEIVDELGDDGLAKKTWRCLAAGCGITRKGLNTTKCLAHCSRDPVFCHRVHMVPCEGTASRQEIQLFVNLMNRNHNKKAAVKRGRDLVVEEIKASHAAVAAGISEKKPKAFPTFTTPSRSSVTSADSTPVSSRQLDVATSFGKSTIQGCKSADLDAAIAQMVYCKATANL